MIIDEYNIFLERKRKQINSLSDYTFNYFNKYCKPRFFIPKTFEDVDNIQLRIEVCKTQESIMLWETCLLFQSIHINPTTYPGCSIRYLIHNDYNNTILGLIRLSSPMSPNKHLIDYIGWTKENIWKEKMLQHLVNAQCLVPLQPFGYNCLGGKLLTLLSITKDITDEWYKKYNRIPYAIITTSLTGGCNQYSGIKEFIKLCNTESEIERGFYISSLYSNTKELMCNKTKNIDKDLRPDKNIVISNWKNKAKKRIQSLIKDKRIKQDIEVYDYLKNKIIDNPFFNF